MKITLTRVLETTKILATEVGQQIPDFFSYMAEFVEQVVRTLRNGLTFQDNFDCAVKIYSLVHNVTQVISSDRPVQAIQVMRVYSQTQQLVGFNWSYNDQGQLTVTVSFSGAPTGAIDVTLNLLF